MANKRFVSHYIILKRLKRLMDCREALATTISLNSKRDWVKRRYENTRVTRATVAHTIRSEEFLEDIESILVITEPIFLLIKFCDGDGSKLGEMYEKMDNMLEKIKDVMLDNKYASNYTQPEKMVLSRWETMTISLYYLGFALSPLIYDSRYLDTLAPCGIPKKS